MDEQPSDIQVCEDCLAPAEAFSVVASETRLRILEALWNTPDRPVTFSELRRAVEMDDSAQFNYHLDKLTGQFVKKVEAGYVFRYAGEKVVRAVLEGSFNQDPELPPFEIDGSCIDCGGGLEARYAEELMTIECGECRHRHGQYAFPPGGLNDRSRAEILDAFNQRVRHLHCLAADGVCPECGGRMGSKIVREPRKLELDIGVVHRCSQCRHEIRSAVGLRLLDQSDVVSFYREQGIDLPATPYWRLGWCVSNDFATVLSEDPWRIRLRMPVDGEELRMTVDGDLDVVSVERRRETREAMDSPRSTAPDTA